MRQALRRFDEHRAALVVAAIGLVIAVPLLIGLAVMRQPPWVPVVDLTLTELRVRDTLSAHPPLLGLPGRVGTLDRQGSHPGPMSFYLLAVIYRLLGSTAWALQAATVGVHLLAAGVTLWIGYRRGGRMLAAGAGLMLGVLTVGFGVRALAEPWNPYLPVLMWVVFLLAVWSVVVGDVPLLPVAAAAGTLCAQTHISYLALYLGLGTLALGAAVWWARARGPGAERRRAVRWMGAALGVAAVLWLPPVYQQLRATDADPGNVSILADHFATSPEPAVGLRSAAGAVVAHLDATYLILGQLSSPGELSSGFAAGPNRAVGAGVLVVWLAAAAAAIWLRHARLVGLHAVVAGALAIGLVSASRIFGVPWYYLTLWLWGIAAVMLLAIGWTIVAVVGRLRPMPTSGTRPAVIGFWVLAGMVALVAGRLSFAATRVDGLHAMPSRVITAILPDVTAAIDDGSGEATGRDGRYLVTWSDSLNLGENGFGLFGELERRGYDVGVPSPYHTQFGAHRVLEADDATAQIVLATGVSVDEWRAVPGVVEVGFFDPRSPSERVEYTRVRGQVIDSLDDDGLDDLVAEVDRNLFAVGLDPRLSTRTRELLVELHQFGLPTAVLVAPADASVTVASESAPAP
ncbi:MAG: hypothetical protein ACRD0A_20725 [Acidimicrobiales bacterium]